MDLSRVRADPRQFLGATALLLLCIIMWMLTHGYRGIFHDAALYTLQALGREDGGTLSQDVFLRFGSQDRYTVFSPIFAAASRLLGPESAAAIFTLLSQFALFAAAWVLARTVMPASLALLGVTLLVAIPGYYGAYRVFAVVEPFLTPRMAAEALAVAGIAAALSGRHRLAMLLIVLAMAIHPIMAAAGGAALFSIYILIPRPRIGAILLGAAMLAIACMGRFDALWLQLVTHRSPYLFLANWGIDDWGGVAVTLATLTIGLRTLQSGRARVLCEAAVWTTAGGLVLALCAGDELRAVLPTQLQPWRWEWLGVAAAALLLPLIIQACWSIRQGRAAALALIAAWIFGATSFALIAALAALAAIAFARRLRPGEARLVLWGGCALLAIAVAWRLATNLQFTDAHYLEFNIPFWARRAMSFTHDGSVPLAVIALIWWLTRTARGAYALTVIAMLAATACIALVPTAWAQWSAREYPPDRVARFAAWRELIAPGAEVFWPDSPLSAWLFLARPNYLSALQTSGMVFSRSAALEFQRRAEALGSIVTPQAFVGWDGAGPGLGLSTPQLAGICRLSVFEYLVTGVDLGMAPIAVLPGGAHVPTLRLYRCQARAAAAT